MSGYQEFQIRKPRKCLFLSFIYLVLAVQRCGELAGFQFACACVRLFQVYAQAIGARCEAAQRCAARCVIERSCWKFLRSPLRREKSAKPNNLLSFFNSKENC